MKKFISVLICSILIISSMSVSFADKKESTPIFFEFISNADISEIEVIASSGDILNTKYSNDIKKDLLLGNYDKVIECLTKYDLALSYENREVDSKDVSLRSLESEVEFSKDFYHIATESRGKIRKEWITNLKMKHTENSDGTFTASGNPRMTVTADFGGSFAVKVQSYSTGYKYKNSKKAIEFYGSYDMDADAIVPITIAGLEFPVGFTLHWGQINVNHTIK